jgi:hypothetical protein
VAFLHRCRTGRHRHRPLEPRQASELLIGKAAERSQGKGGNCTMAIVKLVKPAEA